MAELVAQVVHGVRVLGEDQHRWALPEDLVQLGLQHFELGIGDAEQLEFLDKVLHVAELGRETFGLGRRCVIRQFAALF